MRADKKSNVFSYIFVVVRAPSFPVLLRPFLHLAKVQGCERGKPGRHYRLRCPVYMAPSREVFGR